MVGLRMQLAVAVLTSYGGGEGEHHRKKILAITASRTRPTANAKLGKRGKT